MGTDYSRNRIMDDEDVRSRSGSEDDSDQEIDYAAILQSLISRYTNGSVHIIPSNYDDVEQYPPLPKLKHVPNTTTLDASEFSSSVKQACGLGISRIKFPKTNFTQMLLNREKGMTTYTNFSHPNKCRIANEFLPNAMKTLEAYAGKAFCGTFSKNGNHFITASQDRQIRVYKSDDEYYKLVNNIYARDVGWSIIDVGFSPDQEHFVYSTWSSSLHMCSINGDSDKQEQLCLVKTGRRFCVFSVLFSSDGTEILGGANDGCLYIYDMIRKERTLRTWTKHNQIKSVNHSDVTELHNLQHKVIIETKENTIDDDVNFQICAHDYDVNSVAFADDTSQIIYSGGDDGLIKVWDRRTLNEENPTPVGTLAGHMDGITFIDSKGDSRHLISNSKDQSIKLWDVRVFSDPRAADNTLRAVHDQTWDYRWQEVPKKLYSNKNKIEGDTSIMTYKGHIVIKTLVRCRFSPMSTTGQRYIYTGCGGGRVVVYDALTGKIKRDLSGHNACVRDVSWHPYRNEILSSSWDGMVGLWTYKGPIPFIEAEDSEDSFSSSSRHSERPLRRSLRLAIKKHVQGKVQPEQ